MAEEIKDTIYVDIDDEITAVIDKVQASGKKVVALVLPKRAPVFQSIVNMKLLKRKSDEAKKNLVLVTTEAGILPLAGAVGLHVSKTLASKPEIPEPPEKVEAFINADEDEPIHLGNKEEKAAEAVDLKSIANEPVGKLSGSAKEEDTIELDNEAVAAEAAAAEEKHKETPKKAKKDKHLKVPNFERFRLLIALIVGGIIILIVLLILAFKYLPKATIDIKTNAQNVPTNLNFNLSSAATTLDPSTNTIPAKQVNETKTYTSTVNTTGQQNAQAASGPLTIIAQSCSGHPPAVVPGGTTVTQAGFSYTTQSDATYTSFGSGGGSCTDFYGNTTIVANSPGSGSNVGSNTNFTVTNGPHQQSGITVSGSGSASGGADATQIVAQADISTAENKISADSSGAKSDLDNQLTQAGLLPLNVTFTPGTPNASPSTAVGGAATTVTVTETINYTLYGVKRSYLTSLLDTAINSQVSSNQSILDTGLSGGSYSIGSGATNINLATKAIVGPNINIAALKKKIEGYKSTDIEALILGNPNVTKVSVHFSPFFVSSAPSNPNRITINISKPTNS